MQYICIQDWLIMLVRNCHLAFHFSPHSYFVLREAIECGALDCFSPIYAVSRFCSETLASILPPLHGIIQEEIQANETKCFKPMCEAWNIHLLNIVTKTPGNVFRDRQNFYILVALREDSLKQLQSQKALFFESSIQKGENENEKTALSKIFEIDVPCQKKLKFALYQNKSVSQGQIYTPRSSYGPIFVGAFFNNQQWRVFDIPNGEVPTVEQLLTCDAVLLTGSPLSVLDRSPSAQKAIEVLGTAYSLSKHLKIVGVCYGHQTILQHFGALVVKKQLIPRLQYISFDKAALQKHPSLSPLGEAKCLSLSEYHGDFVEDVPENFDLIGRSESCKVEATLSKDARILTFQFHSELPHPYMKRLSEQMESVGKNLGFKLDYTNQEVLNHIKSSELIIQTITEFMGR